MDKFVKELKRKRWLNLGGSLLAVFYVAFYLWKKFAAGGSAFDGFFHGFQLGLLMAMVGFMMVDFVKTQMALRNDDKLKAMYVDETDERKLMIKRELGKMTLNVNYGALIIATVVAGFFNETVFSTLMAVLLFFALTMIVGKVYYNRKY